MAKKKSKETEKEATRPAEDAPRQIPNGLQELPDDEDLFYADTSGRVMTSAGSYGDIVADVIFLNVLMDLKPGETFTFKLVEDQLTLVCTRVTRLSVYSLREKLAVPVMDLGQKAGSLLERVRAAKIA